MDEKSFARFSNSEDGLARRRWAMNIMTEESDIRALAWCASCVRDWAECLF